MSGFDLPGIGGFVARPPQGGGAAALPPSPPLLGDDLGGREAAVPAGGASFGDRLAEVLESTAGLQREVRNQTEAMFMGEPVALHDVMLAMGKSEVSFNLMLEVRNKLVEAWEKLSRSVM